MVLLDATSRWISACIWLAAYFVAFFVGFSLIFSREEGLHDGSGIWICEFGLWGENWAWKFNLRMSWVGNC